MRRGQSQTCSGVCAFPSLQPPLPQKKGADQKFSDKKTSHISEGKDPREQASLLARPESALCTRTGRGNKKKLRQTSRLRLGLRSSVVEPFRGAISESSGFFQFLFDFLRLIFPQNPRRPKGTKPQRIENFKRNILRNSCLFQLIILNL